MSASLMTQGQTNAHDNTKAVDGSAEQSKSAEQKPQEGVKPEAAAADSKTEGDKKPEAKAEGDKKPEEKKPEGAPEKYADFTVPEGVKLEAATIGEFTNLAKDLNLSQEKAQKLIDLATKHSTSISEQYLDQWHKTQDAWSKEIKEDAEFGGAKYNQTIERVRRAANRFGGAEMFKALDEKGFVTLPEMMRLLARVDQATSEDSVIDGGPSNLSEISAAEAIYGKKQ